MRWRPPWPPGSSDIGENYADELVGKAEALRPRSGGTGPAPGRHHRPTFAGTFSAPSSGTRWRASLRWSIVGRASPASKRDGPSLGGARARRSSSRWTWSGCRAGTVVPPGGIRSGRRPAGRAAGRGRPHDHRPHGAGRGVTARRSHWFGTWPPGSDWPSARWA